jgi:hypothetical protein
MIRMDIRDAGSAACLAALLTVPLAVLSVPAGDEAHADPCRAEWCRTGGLERAIATMLDEQVDELTAARDCWQPAEIPPGVIPSDLLVRGVEVGQDSGVVRVVTFDDGWRLARAGDAYVMAACR